MTDIYHSIQPEGEEIQQWHRQTHTTPKANMSLMHMDKLSSYTFYHVQMQEELPGCNGKHLSIWSSEHIALLYQETPDGGIKNPHKGMLDTRNTPGNWSAVMIPHFRGFPDGELYHSAEVLLTLSEADL